MYRTFFDTDDERGTFSQMTLLFKCLTACLIMIAIHFLSRTPNYFISALLLSFPGLSMTAYWFMYRDLGAQKVIDTAHFGAGAGLAASIAGIFILKHKRKMLEVR